MPFKTRPAAVKISVIVFFVVAIIGQCCEISSFCCCKRATLAAIAAFFVTTLFIKAVNLVLLNAMIDKEIDQRREFDSDS